MKRRLCIALGLLLSGSSFATPPTAANPPRCQYAEVATLPLRYAGAGLDIVTSGLINGKPADMLVDTGAYRTFLTRNGTDRLDLPIWPTGEWAGGVGGEVRIYKTRVAGFSIGPAASPPGYLPVLTDFGFSPSFDAIVGAPFLLRFDLELSLATKEMRLLDPRDCAGAFMGYWDPAPFVVPFEDGHDRFTNPRFAVSVNGVQLAAMIDTGAGISTITADAAGRAGVRPGTTRSNVVGVGQRKVPRRHATLDTFAIGDEVVNNAEFGVIETDRDGPDVILGADFLRSHRVLMAMSQKKLYVSYVGGEPFSQGDKLPAWLVAEANGGNPHAQYALSQRYRHGNGVPRNARQSQDLLEKAVAGGSPRAAIASGHEMAERGEFAAGAARLRAGLDRLPTYRYGALWLYLARVQAGQPELARRELEGGFARVRDDEWPAPIANFYLGKTSADKVLKEAASATAPNRRCFTLELLRRWYRVHGNADLAAALAVQEQAQCPVDGNAAAASGSSQPQPQPQPLPQA